MSTSAENQTCDPKRVRKLARVGITYCSPYTHSHPDNKGLQNHRQGINQHWGPRGNHHLARSLTIGLHAATSLNPSKDTTWDPQKTDTTALAEGRVYSRTHYIPVSSKLKRTTAVKPRLPAVPLNTETTLLQEDSCSPAFRGCRVKESMLHGLQEDGCHYSHNPEAQNTAKTKENGHLVLLRRP